MTNAVIFFDDLAGRPLALVGPKAATLGHLRRRDFPVPNGFVIPTTVFQSLIDEAKLGPVLARLEALAREAPDHLEGSPELAEVRAVLRQPALPDATLRAWQRALATLLEETGAVAVRSSATVEDHGAASFAGQHLSLLNVQRFPDLLRAVSGCWESLFSLPALRYRGRQAAPGAFTAMAVIVQVQVACEAAGTLFTVDPVTGAARVVVEATWGLGEAIAQGEVGPDRYLVDRESLAEVVAARVGDKRCQRLLAEHGGTRLTAVPTWRRNQRVLDPSQLGALALLGLHVERELGGPQDVEWGLAGGRWWLLQARPITAAAAPVFATPTDSREWTSGFLDERLVEPVSPLGWSVLQPGLEEFAFREPLRMLGVDPATLEPITRLWQGHPYVQVAVFEALYKLFPDWLLPEDARRFFPNGDVSRRRQAPRPRSRLAPAVWRGLLGAALADPLVVSPFHNAGAWDRFECRYRAAIAALAEPVARLEAAPPINLPPILALIDAVETQNARLLQIHRWSLTHAEVWYSLLRRLAARLLGPSAVGTYGSAMVRDLGDQSMQLNRALQHLAALPQREPAEREQFTAALAAFLAAYGHRSFSLDLRRPGFGADVDQVYELLAGLRESPHEPKSVPLAPAASDRAVGKSRSRLAEGLLSPLARLARRYARLREDQRFAWQRGLALLRRLYCLAGGVLVAQGSLQRADEVFFLTATEVRQAASGAPPDLHAVAHTRQQHFEEDWARFRQDARASYPPFLRGDAAWEPVTPGAAAIETRGGPTRGYRGEPVSPGIGRGPARVVLRPEDLTAIQPGDVLVTRGADPGWTVVFDRLAGLVTESGGQLSHAAVVAREYGLPAVVAVARATELIRSGEPLLVDGTAGLVQKAEPT